MGMSRDLLIRDGCILSMDRAVGDHRRGSVLIRDGRIASVGPGLPQDGLREGTEVIDARGMIVLPGFVDTHRHTWQSALRHRMGDIDFWTYCADMLREIGGRYTAEDVHVGTLLGAVSALEAGTTTLVDWAHCQNTPEHGDAGIDALQASGIRAVFAYGWPRTDSARWVRDSTEPHPDGLERLRRERLADDGALVTMALGARGPEMTTLDITRADLGRARALGIPITMHAGIRDLGPRFRAVEVMAGAGLLGPDLTLVHVCDSSPEEFRLMAAHGVTVSIGPQAEMTMDKLGVLAVGRLLAVGIRPGLSGDTEVAGAGDILTQMKLCLAGERMVANHRLLGIDTPPVTVRDTLEFATIDGARTCGLGDRVGSLTPGKEADVVLLRRDDLNLAPVSDAEGAVVLGAHPGNVDTVIVRGRVVKRDGRMLGIDTARLLAEAGQSRDRLLAAAGKAVRP